MAPVGKRLPSFPPGSNALGRRLPNELVDLQTQSDVEPVSHDPLGQQSRVQQTVGRVALPAGVLAEGRRKNHAANSVFETVLKREIAGKLVVSAISQYELDLILSGEPF